MKSTADPNTAGQQHHRGTQGGIISYRLKVPVASTGVCGESIVIEDALRVVMIASQVIASHEVPVSWGSKGGSLHRWPGSCDNFSAFPSKWDGTIYSEI